MRYYPALSEEASESSGTSVPDITITSNVHLLDQPSIRSTTGTGGILRGRLLRRGLGQDSNIDAF